MSKRTLSCSVVFVDIVGYSKKSVADQMQVRERLNALLAQALDGVPVKDRIVLDTGDGAAVSFLGDPAEALFLGVTLRDALRADGSHQLRTGINLGPVRLVRDINGQPNIIGDGIDVAQRIMSFADINRVFVSRSYYDAVSALSPDYALLFAFKGTRIDKHVREHEVYALGDAVAPERAPRGGTGATVMGKLTHAAHAARAEVMRRPPLATGLAVAVILLAAVGVRAMIGGAEVPATTPEELAASAVILPRPLPRPLPAPPLATDTALALGSDARPAPQPRPAKEPAAAEKEAAPSTLRLAVLPWGEIFIDGNKYGVSPPLRDISLAPGIYKVEVRNPGFASYLQVVEVQPGVATRIEHRFR